MFESCRAHFRVPLARVVLVSLVPVAAIDYPAKVDLLIKDARDHQRRRRALAVVVVVAVILLALVVTNSGGWRGWGAAGTGGSGSLARFSYQGISFSYPARWLAQNKGAGLSLEASFVVALSTEHLASSCRYSGNTGECGAHLMLSHLRRNGVFLAWTLGGLVIQTSPTLEGRPGKLIEVGGKAARIDVERFPASSSAAGGGCQPETTLSVTVETVNQYHLLACTNGNDGQFESDVVDLTGHLSNSRFEILLQRLNRSRVYPA